MSAEGEPRGGVVGWAVRRPVSVSVGVILVVLFGLLSVRDLPIQLTPDVTVPFLSVTTAWPGATPREIESEIIEEQEEALKSLPGLVRMTSESRQGQASLELELEVGSSLEEALVRVSNLLSQVSDYPQNAREPAITTASSAGPPMAVLVIQSDPPGREIGEYRSWLDEELVPQLERIPGVADIRLAGGQDTEIHVDFEPRALASRGLTVSDVARTVQSELRDVSAGDLSVGKRRITVRTEVAPAVPSVLERAVLAVDESGTPVTLGSVATVKVGLRKRDSFGLFNGEPSMALLFDREAGSNVLEVTEEIHATAARLQSELLDAEGLEIKVVSDQVGYITGALDLVRENLLLGGALAVVVLLLFLRSVGASTVVALSIPISIVGTVLAMSLAGRTVNIVSLAGMAFAVGMVVDNSIVVLENIDTWRRRTTSIAAAALRGTLEVWGAILASTLTTAAVFIPVLTWEDEVGQLLRDVAVAVSTAVFVSLVVSVVVIPSFAARLLRRPRGSAPPEEEGEVDEDLGRVGRAVHWLCRRPLRALVVGAAGIAVTAGAGLLLVPPMEYLPTGNRNVVFGVVLPPPGTSVEALEEIGAEVGGQMAQHVDREIDGAPALDRSFFVGMPDNAFFGAVAVDPDRAPEVVPLLRRLVADIPDVIAFANQGSLFGRRLGGGRAIEIDVSGRDLGEVGAVAGQLFGAVMGALPGAQVRPIPGLDPGAPELRLEPRRAQAGQLGFTSAELGLLVDAYVDGAIIGELARAGEPKRDVLLRAVGVEIADADDLLAAPAATPAGQTVPLGRLVRAVDTLGPTIIQHIERRRAVTLQVSPPEDIALEDAIARVRDDVVAPLLASGSIPPDVRVDLAGSASQLEAAQGRFAGVLALAVLISFLLLAALFEDFLAPIAILVTVPLAGAGGILGLRLVDRFLGAQSLDMMTALGFVILIGVVVNNAILIVDGALARMRERGMELADAVASAVRWRVRPILMSVLTSLAGLLPLVLLAGAGSELYRGVGSVVLGGLALSTALSLFLVPAVFTVLWTARARLRRDGDPA